MSAGICFSPWDIYFTLRQNYELELFMMPSSFKRLIYLEGDRGFGAVEAYGNNGVFGCVVLGAVGDASCLSLMVQTILPFFLCADNGWDEGPSPGHPTLVCFIGITGLHVEVLARAAPFHIYIHS